jgi:hypothetical protein
MWRRCVTVCSVCVLLLVSFVTALPSAAQGDARCFQESGACLTGRFRQYWEQNGGLSVFGYPLANAAQEQRPEGTFLVQRFERNIFELHPENQPPYDVLLGRLGVDRLEQQGRNWFTFPKASPAAPHYFATTGHAVTHEPFWQYWRTHGLDLGDPGISDRESLALFGAPISPTEVETNRSGNTVLTQHFERARFEWYPTNPDPFKVQLGILGTELRDVAIEQGQAPPAPAPQPSVPPALPTAVPTATPRPPTAVPASPTPTPRPPQGNCHPSYPDVCIPPPPPDLDCPEIPYRNFRVIGSDPHRFDGDNDGIGCET